jgi:membrane protein DedA with SNARE-associated domain
LLALSILGGLAAFVITFMTNYGYLAIFVLMVLESASLPIPSEVVLPLAGLLAARGILNPYLAFAVIAVAGLIGATIDYHIAYFLGKDVVYKHLQLFRVKRKTLEDFDRWFERNGAFTVFIGRLIPEVRGLVSLPAGFTAMPKRKFYAYTMAGMLIWNAILMSFGYYALDANNAYVAMISVAVLAVVLYIVYRLALGRKRD